ncbi:MAG: anti-sigma factor RsiW [Myxococcota bacterium]|jgi:anti-sigma factor RsiW
MNVTKMNRQQLDDQMVSYLYGELSTAETAAFEAGLEDEPALAAEVRAHRETRSVARQLPSYAMPEGLLDGVMAAATAAAEAAPTPKKTGVFVMLAGLVQRPAFAMVCMITLVAGVSVILLNRGPGQSDHDRQMVAPRPVSAEPSMGVGGASAPEPESAPRANVATDVEREVPTTTSNEKKAASEPTTFAAEDPKTTAINSPAAASKLATAPAVVEPVAETKAAASSRKPRVIRKPTGNRRSADRPTKTRQGVRKTETTKRTDARAGKDLLTESDKDDGANVTDQFGGLGGLGQGASGGGSSEGSLGAGGTPQKGTGSGGDTYRYAPAPPKTPAESNTSTPSAPEPTVRPAPADDSEDAEESEKSTSKSVPGSAERHNEAVTVETVRRRSVFDKDGGREKGRLDQLADLWKRYDGFMKAGRLDDADEVLDEIARLTPDSPKLRGARKTVDSAVAARNASHEKQQKNPVKPSSVPAQ